MKLVKDILFIDFEGITEPVQVGAVLLDKDTLEEKDSFLSYIWADLKGKIVLKSGISQEMLEGAPTQAEVGKKMFEKFGTNILIGSWVANADIRNFDKIMRAGGIKGIGTDGYDFHILDIWPAAYLHLIKQGYEGGIDSESIFREFGAKPRGLHNALEDCRIAAEILRRIVL